MDDQGLHGLRVFNVHRSFGGQRMEAPLERFAAAATAWIIRESNCNHLISQLARQWGVLDSGRGSQPTIQARRGHRSVQDGDPVLPGLT